MSSGPEGGADGSVGAGQSMTVHVAPASLVRARPVSTMADASSPPKNRPGLTYAATSDLSAAATRALRGARLRPPAVGEADAEALNGGEEGDVGGGGGRSGRVARARARAAVGRGEDPPMVPVARCPPAGAGARERDSPADGGDV